MNFTKVFSEISISIILLFLGICLFPNSAKAIGLSPPTISAPSFLRNTTQQRTVSLLRGIDDIGDVFIHVEPGGPAGHFISSGPDDIILKKDDKKIDYTFDINPGDAPNGEYEVYLRFLKTNPPDFLEKQDKFAVSVVTGVTAQIFVTVGGEEHLSYSLLNIASDPAEVGKKLSLKYWISNTGNVDWKIGKIVFNFLKNSDKSLLKSTEIPALDIPNVKAGQENQQFNMLIDHGLTEGEYLLSAVFYEGEKEAGTIKSERPFSIFASGVLAQKGTLKEVTLNKSIYKPGEKVKLDALFSNDGDIGLDAFLVTNIYRDDELLDLKKGTVYRLSPAETTVFSEIFEAENTGSYRIESYIEYGNKKTEMKSVEFKVGSGESTFSNKIGNGLNSFFTLGILIVIIFVSMFLFLFIKKRTKVELPSIQEQSPSTNPPLKPPTLPNVENNLQEAVDKKYDIDSN